MKKLISGALAVMCLIAIPGIGHAQTTKATSKNTTTSGAVAGAEAVGAIFMPGALGGAGAAGAASAAASASGLLSQPQLIMNSTNAPSTGTFNDCGVAWSGAIWLVSASFTSESKDCKAQREAIMLATTLRMPDAAKERMCDIEGVRNAISRTNEPQCAQTIQERERAVPRPVAVAPVSVRQAAYAPPPNCTMVPGTNSITCN